MENGARYAGNATAAVGRVKAMEEENKIRDTLLDSRIITTSRSDAIVRFVDGGSRREESDQQADVDFMLQSDDFPKCNSVLFLWSFRIRSVILCAPPSAVETG